MTPADDDDADDDEYEEVVVSAFQNLILLRACVQFETMVILDVMDTPVKTEVPTLYFKEMVKALYARMP